MTLTLLFGLKLRHLKYLASYPNESWDPVNKVFHGAYRARSYPGVIVVNAQYLGETCLGEASR